MPSHDLEISRFWYYLAGIATIILIWFLSITANISAPTQSYFLAGIIIYAVGALWFDKNGLQSSLPAVLLLTGFLYAIFHLVYDYLPGTWYFLQALSQIASHLSSSRSFFHPVSRRRLLPVTAAMSLLIFSLAGVWGFKNPGLHKAGRILIDEKHSNWEWTTEEFDTRWYGEKSTYNYYSLFEHLRRFYSVDRSHEVLTDTLLDDYAEKNFFPREKMNEETMEFGLFVQAAGVRYGKGRVLDFTDSTVWSNFYMYIPGKPELLLGCMEWLNRRNSRWEILHKLFLIAAIATLAFSIWFGAKLSRVELLWTAVFSIAFVLPLSTQIFSFVNRTVYPRPQAKRDFVKVSFEMEHSGFELPILHMTQHKEHSFHTFYISPQRLGMVPSVKTDFMDALVDADAAVIINPQRPFSDEELQQLESYLKTGGKVLILDDPRGYSTANQLLAGYGLRVDPVLNDSMAVFSWHNGADSLRFSGPLNGVVNGGEPVVMAETGESSLSRPLTDIRQMQPIPFGSHSQGRTQPRSPVIAPSSKQARNALMHKPALSIHRVGKGMIAVMSSSAVFADGEMGFSSAVPNANMQNIYELEFWIFSRLFELGSRQGDDKS